ncbi:MAG: hypothetical protein QNI99_12330 [Woeseiaceae bacterium]|nr:hypothetical protein [Woeseiaceae bacterium]
MLSDLLLYTTYASTALLATTLVLLIDARLNAALQLATSIASFVFLVLLVPNYTQIEYLTALGVGVVTGLGIWVRFSDRPLERYTIGQWSFFGTLIGGLLFVLLSLISDFGFFTSSVRLPANMRAFVELSSILFVLNLLGLWVYSKRGYRWVCGAANTLFVLFFVNYIITLPILLAVWLGYREAVVKYDSGRIRIAPIFKPGVLSMAVVTVIFIWYFVWIAVLFLTPRSMYMPSINPFLALVFCLPAFFFYGWISTELLICDRDDEEQESTVTS